MNNLKEKMKNIYLTLKKSIEKFPLTIIIIIILTLMWVINLEQDFIKENILMDIAFFAITFANGTFLVETLISDNKKRNISYIIPAIISLVFTCFYASPEFFEQLLSRQILDWLANLYTCYMISIFSVSIYYNYKKSGKTFEEYVTSVFVNAFKASLVYGILSIGIAIVSGIFVYLILDGENYLLIARLELLILGIYYIPMMLYALYDAEEQTSKFARVVIKYVLGTLVITAFVIIYMYIIKIIALRDMPSNQIFRILTALFIIGCPIWTMIEKFKEESIIDKINNKLPILFIPFIVLQIYSIGLRISSNGITESRYLCIMLIVFEIIYTIIRLSKKEEVGKVILLFSVLTVISSIAPYINMYSVSRISQFNNLKIFKEKNEYTEEDKEKIVGAYEYLRSSDEGKKYINSFLSSAEESVILKLRKDKYDYEMNSIEYVSASCTLDYIDVSEYNSLYKILESDYNYDTDKKKIEEVFSNLEIELEENRKINIDIYDRINEYINHNSENFKNDFKKMNKINVDDNRILILTNISISYDKMQKTIESYSLSGYLLER